MKRLSLSFSGRNLELVINALVEAQENLTAHINGCPDPEEHSVRLAELHKEKREMDLLLKRIRKRIQTRS